VDVQPYQVYSSQAEDLSIKPSVSTKKEKRRVRSLNDHMKNAPSRIATKMLKKRTRFKKMNDIGIR
jgi:hypothetical protein